jgi:hypothetical protein
MTFSKTFVDHLQFEQLIFFWLKVKLLESSWFPKINYLIERVHSFIISAKSLSEFPIIQKLCLASHKLPSSIHTYYCVVTRNKLNIILKQNFELFYFITLE